MRVTVRNNNVDGAIRLLKKKLQKDGLIRELREREYFRSKGEKKRLARAAGRRRWLKAEAKRKAEQGF